MNSGRTGVLIVLEGTDGSGKSTQFELLGKRLKEQGYDAAAFDFPQYEKPSSYFVKRYLNGDYGPLDSVSPYTCSLFYALDRLEAAPEIQAALQAGKIVICNRFTGSSMAHQGAKINSAEERRGYFIWLDNVEFELLRIPRPDISFILRVPAETAQAMVGKKPERSYTTQSHDIHEADLEHLKKSVEVYDDLAKLFPKDFQRLDCVRSGKIMSVEAVHDLLWEKILPLLPPLKVESSSANQPVAPRTETPSGLKETSQIVSLEASGLLEPRLVRLGWLKKATRTPAAFFTPPSLDPEAKAIYQKGMSKLIAQHNELIQKLAAYLTDSNPAPSKSEFAAWQQNIQTEASAASKASLPVAAISVLSYPLAAITKQLAEELAGDDLLEAQAAAKALAAQFSPPLLNVELKAPLPGIQPSGGYAGPTASVVLVSAWPRNELDLLPEVLYRGSNLSLANLNSSIAKWPYDRKAEAFEAQLAAQPKQLLSRARYDWELLTSYEVFCQLQKHLAIVQAQELTPRYGYDIPQLVEESGLTGRFEQCFDLSLELQSQLQKAGHASESQYATLFGHRLRWKMSCTAEQLLEVYRQCEGQNSNVETASLLQSMREKVLETHPGIGEVLQPTQYIS